MARIGYRIIPKEKEWLVEPLVNGVVVNEPVRSYTSRTKALNNIIKKFFTFHSGRNPFDIILEIEDDKP